MEKQEQFSALVEEMNALGNGIVKQDGCVVFCIGAVDGDQITAQVTTSKKNYKTAEILSLDEPSPHRCQPDCDAFGTCGGCSLRHITYAHELEIKRASVEAALRRAGLGKIEVPEILHGSCERYRNKAVFHFTPKGKVAFMEGASAQYVPVSDCRICPEEFSEIAAWSEAWFGKAQIVPAYLYLRTNRSRTEMSVTVGISEKNPSLQAYSEQLMEQFSVVVGVFAGSGKHPEERGARIVCICGKDTISEQFLGLSLSISPASFFQVHPEAAELLCQKAAAYLAPKAGACGVDLYCGTGIFGMTIAQMFPQVFVTGVEINEAAVEDARANAAANGLGNIGFFCGDSGDFAKKIYGSVDFVLIDPPRAGCSEKMMQALIRMKSEKIVYVSCDPGTLGRDLAKLSDGGYQLSEICACDLFPRTKHVETVVLLSRKNDKR